MTQLVKIQTGKVIKDSKGRTSQVFNIVGSKYNQKNHLAVCTKELKTFVSYLSSERKIGYSHI